jgi:hypothetical protein
VFAIEAALPERHLLTVRRLYGLACPPLCIRARFPRAQAWSSLDPPNSYSLLHAVLSAAQDRLAAGMEEPP